MTPPDDCAGGPETRPPAPMLAALADAPLVDERLAYEPKYDGVRALVEIRPAQGPGGIRIWSRLGNEKTAQFSDLVDVLARFARALKRPVLLDGEIVALDASGEPAGFQRLQGRIHGGRPGDGAGGRRTPVAYIAFDVLRDGEQDLRPMPLHARRARLERIIGSGGSSAFRASTFVPGDGRELYREALARGREGIIVKRLDSPYASGRRSPDWKKVKLVGRQDCVVGGWTEPRESRPFFGALLLGVWDGEALEYVGHTGTGFTHAELARVMRRLQALEQRTCPFRERPRTNERPHWVRPELVASVKFSEWTRDGRLRAPVYLGLRDDVPARAVRRDPFVRADARAPAPPARPVLPEPLAAVHAALEALEARRADGAVTLPGGARLEVTNLAKVLWPGPGLTKGDLLRYYVAVSPALLPAVADRPLVMKRFPNGIAAKAFYQQRAPDPVPAGVRVERLPADATVPSRLIGGSLLTLLYMAQLAVVSQDPWFARVGSLETPDHVALDLDPMPGVGFPRVLDVARWIRDELEALGIPGVPKTSGADGLHVYIPLPPGTSWETARLFCQILATIVADKHPAIATVERDVHARGRKVYVDYLQNLRGKTLATAYSARASEFAGVSAPLTWDEIDAGVDRRDFTLSTMPGRLAAVGDLWARLRTSPPADLRAVLRYARPAAARPAAPAAARPRRRRR